MFLSLAGCSSSSGATASHTAGVTGTATDPAADTAAGTAGTSAATTGADSPTTSSTAASPSGAGHPARPDDACALLTSDQVAAAVGSPGPYTGAHEDPAADGSPVWGCTWGTRTSYADITEVPTATFQKTPDPSDITTTPVSGIGDQARMDTMTPDGRNPEILFTAGGRYYDLSVVLSRSELGAANAGQEENAERMLGKLLAAKLSS